MRKPEVTVRVEHSESEKYAFHLSTISSVGITRLKQVVPLQINHVLDMVLSQ
jgi:hypothetical protein